MDVQVVCDSLDFPEGPVALADGSVIVCEMRSKLVTRVTPEGRREVLVETGGTPNGAAIAPDGALIICNSGGSAFAPESYRGGRIERYDLRTGELVTLYEACDGVRLSAPNDLVFDRQGGFWFTDYPHSDAISRRHGGLFYARPDGSAISRQRDRLLTPNGVGLSPDESVVYVADTEPGRLWAFDVAEPGILKPAEWFAPGRVVAKTPGCQLLDSLAVEEGGKVCVGALFPGGISIFDPEGALEQIALPDPFCTNICFGGADMRDAWVTGSGSGKLFKLRWPRPGHRLNFNG